MTYMNEEQKDDRLENSTGTAAEKEGKRHQSRADAQKCAKRIHSKYRQGAQSQKQG